MLIASNIVVFAVSIFLVLAGWSNWWAATSIASTGQDRKEYLMRYGDSLIFLGLFSMSLATQIDLSFVRNERLQFRLKHFFISVGFGVAFTFLFRQIP